MFEKTRYKLQICFVIQIEKEVLPHIPLIEKCFMNALTEFSTKRNV